MATTAENPVIRILQLEDSSVDAELIQRRLMRDGLSFTATRVETRDDFLKALQDYDPDIALVDISLPTYDGRSAIRDAQEQNPDLPLVIVSGTLGEDTAVAMLKLGAADYILKQNMQRLKPAIDGAVREAREVRERRRAREALRRVNRALRVISECNETLIRAVDEQVFLSQICEILVERGGYRMAWVGYAGDGAGGDIRPMASSGFEDGFLKTARFSVGATDKLGQGAAGRAFRSRSPVVIDVSDPGYRPWRNEARRRGYRSVISLPLFTDDSALGVLAIYSAEAHAFIADEIELLTQLAGDLSYGITTIRAAARRRLAEEALMESEARYRNLVETSPDAIVMLDLGGRMLMCNPMAAVSFGFDNAVDMTGLPVADAVAAGDRKKMRAALKGVMRAGSFSLELNFRRRDGSVFPGDMSGSLITGAGGKAKAIMGIIRDVSERRESERQLREAMSGAIQAIALTVESRDPYTAGHQRRVANLARAIAQRMHLDSRRIEAIRMAGAIHDLGKIHVPSEILTKPGLLNDAEFSIIKNHSQIGYDILCKIDFPWPVADIVRQHHEKINGSGYPRGLKQKDIMLEARILVVADVVEAMASHRPYRPARGIDQALSEIRNYSGSLYDPDVVKSCLEIFDGDGFDFDQEPLH